VIIDSETVAMLREGESSVSYMYLDSSGNATVGVGNMLPTAAAAAQLPFVNIQTGLPASALDIGAEWTALRARPSGQNYGAAYYEQFATLKLTGPAIDSLLLSRIEEFQKALAASFPKYSASPPKCQRGILDMAFNVGVDGLRKKFPEFINAVENADWIRAATQCHSAAPISETRNSFVRNLFQISAAEIFEGIWVGQLVITGQTDSMKAMISRNATNLTGQLTVVEPDGEAGSGPMRTIALGTNRSISFLWEDDSTFTGTLSLDGMKISGTAFDDGIPAAQFSLHR
jgi:GH24 family phage-related lysozyme (muramidase)